MHYLYIFCVSNAAKIGITSDVERRRKEIQAYNPSKIHVACTFTFANQDDAHKVEQSLHRYFQNQHIHHEWYRIEPMQVVSLVNMVRVFNSAIDVEMKMSDKAREEVQTTYTKTVNARDYLKQWFADNPEYIQSADSVDVLHKLFSDQTGVSVGRTSVYNVRKELQK